MKTLYLMRHGETLFNVYHRVQGASDSPLTARGIAQAKEAKAFFKKNVAFTSPTQCPPPRSARQTPWS